MFRGQRTWNHNLVLVSPFLYIYPSFKCQPPSFLCRFCPFFGLGFALSGTRFTLRAPVLLRRQCGFPLKTTVNTSQPTQSFEIIPVIFYHLHEYPKHPNPAKNATSKQKRRFSGQAWTETSTVTTIMFTGGQKGQFWKVRFLLAVYNLESSLFTRYVFRRVGAALIIKPDTEQFWTLKNVVTL